MTKFVSTMSLLDNILVLFLIKSGPVLINGSRNHCEILTPEKFFLILYKGSQQ